MDVRGLRTLPKQPPLSASLFDVSGYSPARAYGDFNAENSFIEPFELVRQKCKELAENQSHSGLSIPENIRIHPSWSREMSRFHPTLLDNRHSSVKT